MVELHPDKSQDCSDQDWTSISPFDTVSLIRAFSAHRLPVENSMTVMVRLVVPTENRKGSLRGSTACCMIHPSILWVE